MHVFINYVEQIDIEFALHMFVFFEAYCIFLSVLSFRVRPISLKIKIHNIDLTNLGTLCDQMN